MNLHIGWHQSPDGSSKYWDGQSWMDWDGSRWVLWDGRRWVPASLTSPEPAAARPTAARHGRSHRAAGAMMLVGAILIAGAMFLPWIAVTGPSIGVGFADWVDVAINPSTSLESGPGEREVLLACAFLTGLFALVLMATRGRFSSVMLRLLGLASATLPAIVAWMLWSLATSENPAADLITQDTGTAADALRLGDRLLNMAGVYSVSAAEGLLIWSAGLVLVAVGSILPSSRG